jgi:hypothetical protein
MVCMILKDPAIIEAMEYKGEFHLSDGGDFLIKRISNLAPPNYRPSNEDILYCRRKTIGICEAVIFDKKKNVSIHLLDFGGQRNERKVYIKIET